MNPNKPPLDISGLEDEALQRHLAELRAQVQLEEQRATQRQEEQRRQAAIEEERRLQERLQQLQQDRLSYEQAHSPAHPSLPPAKHARVSRYKNSPRLASSPVAMNTRSSHAVPVSQLPSVSQTTVQPQQGHQEERVKKRTAHSASRLTWSLLGQNTGKDTEPVAKKGQYTLDESRQQMSVMKLGRNVARSSSYKATHETRTLSSSRESTLTGQYSPNSKAQQLVKFTECAKPGSKAEATISTVTGSKAQQSIKLTECAKPGSKAEDKISTVQKSGTGSKAQKSVKHTECAKPGSKEEDKISTPQKGVPKSLSQQCGSASPAGAACQKKTKIKLGSEVVTAVTGEPRWLKRLVAELKPETAKFNWKWPDTIIITCLADNPPENWVQRVTAVVDNIRQSVQDGLSQS